MRRGDGHAGERGCGAVLIEWMLSHAVWRGDRVICTLSLCGEIRCATLQKKATRQWLYKVFLEPTPDPARFLLPERSERHRNEI